MSLSKEEKIIRLRRGIASSETSDALKRIMEADLEELLKPEPVFVPEPPKVKAVKKPVKKKVEVKKEEVVAVIPERTFSQEEKEKLKEEYAQRRLRKKEKENQ